MARRPVFLASWGKGKEWTVEGAVDHHGRGWITMGNSRVILRATHWPTVLDSVVSQGKLAKVEQGNLGCGHESTRAE
jgi:hypothetical protein